MLYVSLLAVYFALNWTSVVSTWWLDLLDTFALYLFIPTLPLLLLGILVLSRSVLVLCVLPVSLFTVLFGGLFLPHFEKPVEPGSTFKVMTYNILGMNRDFRHILLLFRDEAPDVIAIQEVTTELANPLAYGLANEYPYQVLEPRDDYGGVAVFSRFPIEQQETLTILTASHLAQHLTLDANGRELQLFNLHPDRPTVEWRMGQDPSPDLIEGFDTGWQKAQLEVLMDRVEQTSGPKIVLGDLNLTDQTHLYRRVTRKLADAHREAGWGFGNTFPANGRLMSLPMPYPVIRIDYILHSPELVALDVHLGSAAGSDHNPVIAELGFAKK